MPDRSESLIDSLRARYQDLLRRNTAAIGQLSDADLHWRPNPESNSIANLVVHMVGNLRQRMATDIAGRPDVRDRDAEFNTREPYTGAQLLTLLAEVYALADSVLAGLTPAQLREPRTVRGRTVSVMDVALTTATHQAEHSGQIFYIAKARLGTAYQVVSITHKKA